MPSSSIVKILLQYPGSWIYILLILVQNIIAIMSGEKHNILVTIVFTIFAYIIDFFIINRSLELFGLKKIKVLGMIGITIIGSLKLSVFPLILFFTVSSFLTPLIGSSSGIAEIESYSSRLIIAVTLFGLWIAFGINYAIYTNSTKHLFRRIFRMIKASYKEILPLALLYFVTLVISGLLNKISFWSNVSSAVFHLVVIFYYRLWFFEIFSNSKIVLPEESNDLKFGINS